MGAPDSGGFQPAPAVLPQPPSLSQQPQGRACWQEPRRDPPGGADRYQNDFYERPTVQTFENINGSIATSEYFEYLDIVEAQFGFDSQYVYVSIDMFGLDKSTTDGVDTSLGLVEQYGFRMSTDPDGRNGILVFVDQPALKEDPTVFNGDKSFGFLDTDGDVGGAALPKHGDPNSGLNVTKSDNPLEEVGMNGYDTVVIADGKSKSTGDPVLFARINPDDPTIVELALDYKAFGYAESDLSSLEYFEVTAIKGGAKDPQNYLWNDKYTAGEAGSPYLEGTQNVYELDTLRGSFRVPEPGSGILLGIGLMAAICCRRFGRRHSSRSAA